MATVIAVDSMSKENSFFPIRSRRMVHRFEQIHRRNNHSEGASSDFKKNQINKFLLSAGIWHSLHDPSMMVFFWEQFQFGSPSFIVEFTSLKRLLRNRSSLQRTTWFGLKKRLRDSCQTFQYVLRWGFAISIAIRHAWKWTSTTGSVEWKNSRKKEPLWRLSS